MIVWWFILNSIYEGGLSHVETCIYIEVHILFVFFIVVFGGLICIRVAMDKLPMGWGHHDHQTSRRQYIIFIALKYCFCFTIQRTRPLPIIQVSAFPIFNLIKLYIIHAASALEGSSNTICSLFYIFSCVASSSCLFFNFVQHNIATKIIFIILGTLSSNVFLLY